MAILYKDILSNKQLHKLSEHKYSCTSASLMDPWLQPWWNWLVSKTPLWLAPNLITIVGLIINIITTLILIYYSPDGKSAPPRWSCFLCALGLFIYQSLDSIDGKQARRTNTSSPLGELFDHGCDSISTVFVALSACVSCQLGHYPNWLFFQCFCAIGLFYCAHWQTYVSGTLRFGKIDVTEAQFTIMGIHVISAIFGSEVWMTKIPIIGCHWNYIILIGVTLGYLLNVVQFSKMFSEGGSGKNGSTVAGTSVLSPSIPLTLVILPAFIIAQKSPQGLFVEHSSLYIMAFGMVAAKITNKLVIAHMTKAEMEYCDWSLLGPALLFLNQYFNCPVPEIYLLWLTFIWSTQDLIMYCTQVCREICNHLNICLFKIPYPQKVATVSQGTNVPVMSGSQSNSISHDKNGGTHHRRMPKQSTKKQTQH
ncbi:cholinephosphotransferase 1 isoform X3 [Teleopsis dalmanni]|uniref:cholinephosphotransferase 1-like isoform X3 n=1 Tax=Teleopsis dalmanni TaxID=139649 RepID=UPI0018CE5FC7|nr:cholinephosphotransferase 1-like isoform X3 [Teleopsis dalmanni]XP_037947268.1 cholinephosphotransferase 1 isoform X3 [Teleopsis dalmanni]